MGAGASQSFFEKDETGLEVPDAPDNIKALAARLSLAHGINKAILVHGLVALEPCVKSRLNREITKPLDLACLRAFKKEMEGQAVAPDVQTALDALPAEFRSEPDKCNRGNTGRSPAVPATMPSRVGVAPAQLKSCSENCAFESDSTWRRLAALRTISGTATCMHKKK